MKIVELEEAIETLAEHTAGLAKEPLIITSNGQPIAVLVTLENIGVETLSLSTNLSRRATPPIARPLT